MSQPKFSSADHLPAMQCYLNGEYGPLREAKVSVMDRGFIFGDGVYEGIPIHAGKPFRLDFHMARLNRSLSELRMPNPLTFEQWTEVFDRLTSDRAMATGVPAEKTEQLIYLQVTRGVAPRDHAMPQDIGQTVFAMAIPMPAPTADQRANGVACVTAEDFRWKKGHIKSISLLGAVFARQISADVGAVETVMFRDGYLTEASASNVWVVKDGKLLGAPNDNLVLEGIRYGLLEELCQKSNIEFELRRIARDEVLNADELLLSSATKEVLAVTTLDGMPVGTGRPGPVCAQLYAAYQEAKRAP